MSDATNTILTPALDLFSKSWKIVQENLNVFSLVLIAPAAMTLWQTYSEKHYHLNTTSPGHFASSLDFLPGAHYSTPSHTGLWVAFIIGIAGLFSSLLQTILVVRAAQGQHPSFGMLVSDLRRTGVRLFGLQILVGIVIVVGLILLIVPGIYMIRRYFFAQYVMVDQNIGIREAMSRSAALTRGNWGSVYGIIGVIILLGLTGIIPIAGSVISFILAAMYSVSPALRYFELKKLGHPSSPSNPYQS